MTAPTPLMRGEIIGEHASIQDLRRLIAKAATSPARAVLIYGETGTGKGLVARMVHQLSSRAGNEFVDVNCAAIPANLLESELFGHERGAFTGAVGKKVGLIEAANKGSIFLDEIRELDHVLQAKMLTVLDTQRFRRIGSVRPIEVDVRFIAATNKILLSEVKAGNFREDLYYRLQVVAINVPSLRDRGDDIFVLTDHFLRVLSERYRRVIKGLTPEVASIFRRYRWPGNVRELENLLERIFALEDDDTIKAHHLPARIHRTLSGGEPEDTNGRGNGRLDFHQATADFQRRMLREALTSAEGNQGVAAKALGLTRHALRHQLIKLGLR